MFIRIRCCNNRNDPIDHLVCTEKYLILLIKKSQLSKGMSFQIYCFKCVVTVMQYNSRCYGLIREILHLIGPAIVIFHYFSHPFKHIPDFRCTLFCNSYTMKDFILFLGIRFLGAVKQAVIMVAFL